MEMGHASGLGAPSCDRAASCGGREVSYAAGLVAQLDESATRRLRPWKIKKLKKCFAMFDKDKNGVSRCIRMPSVKAISLTVWHWAWLAEH